MASAADNTNLPLAIVGMACRLPGADNLDEYWQLIVEGRSAIAELPADRLDQELYFDPRQGVRGKSYSKLGGRDFQPAVRPAGVSDPGGAGEIGRHRPPLDVRGGGGGVPARRLGPVPSSLAQYGRVHRPRPGQQSRRRLHLWHVRRGGGPVPPRGRRFPKSAGGPATSRDRPTDRRGPRQASPPRSPDARHRRQHGGGNDFQGVWPDRAVPGDQFGLRLVAAGDVGGGRRAPVGPHRHGHRRRRFRLQGRFAGLVLPCPGGQRHRLPAFRRRCRRPDLLRGLRRGGDEDAARGAGRRRPHLRDRPRAGHRLRRPRQEPLGAAEGRPDQGHGAGLCRRRRHRRGAVP